MLETVPKALDSVSCVFDSFSLMNGRSVHTKNIQLPLSLIRKFARKSWTCIDAYREISTEVTTKQVDDVRKYCRHRIVPNQLSMNFNKISLMFQLDIAEN